MALSLAAIGGYLIGSIPWAYIVVRLRASRDVRREGTGNVGALNSYVATGSKGVGVVVLLLDAAKGLGAVLLASVMGGGSVSVVATAALGVVLGHNYPIWLRFQGGRGLAPAAGGMLGIAWIVVPAWCFVWGIGYLLLRSVNPASALACVVIAAAAILLPDGIVSLASGGEWGTAFRTFVAALMFVLLARLVGEVRAFLSDRRKRQTTAAGR